MIAADIETTTDAFLGGALMIRQPKAGYRAGIDPVLLAATCRAEAGERVLDCGAGVGTIGLTVARRIADTEVVLVERSPTYAALATANVTANGLNDRVTVATADLTLPLSRNPALSALVGTIDHALANPPYQVDSDGTRSATLLKDEANAMPAGSLTAWLRFMAAMVRPNGTVAIIHRADALPELLEACHGRFGGLMVSPLYSRQGEPANRVIVRGIKGSRAPFAIRPGLLIHDENNAYLPAIDAVLRHGAAISL